MFKRFNCLYEISASKSLCLMYSTNTGPQDMNDEMMNSPFVPDELQCDACVAVSFKVNINHRNKMNLIL